MCTESKRIEVAGVMPHITGGPNYCVGRYSSSYTILIGECLYKSIYVQLKEGAVATE